LNALAKYGDKVTKGAFLRHFTGTCDAMLEKLAGALGVSAFQLLVPADDAALRDGFALISVLLRNLQQNIQDDINAHFNRINKDF